MMKKKATKKSVKRKSVNVLKKELAIEKRIKPIQSLPSTITAAFYGRAGTGKTTLLGTFPKPLLLLDCDEEGHDSISDVKGIDTLEITSWEDYEEIYWYLLDGNHNYKTVGIDPVTSLQNICIKYILREEGKDVEELMNQKNWGSVSKKMIMWVTNYRNLSKAKGINVVFLAHERVFDVDDQQDFGELAPEVSPRLMPSVSNHLCGAVKIIGRTFIREEIIKGKLGKRKERNKHWSLLLSPHSFYTAKIRNPKGSFIPDYIDNPDYNQLLTAMKGELKPQTNRSKVKKKVSKKINRKR